MTRRKKAPLRPLCELEHAQLLKTSRSHTEAAVSVARAKALLAVVAGSNYLQAAQAVGYRNGDCVAGWVHRFNSEGLAARQPRHGGGAPKKYASAEREQILNMFRKTPDRDQEGTATWSLSTLQKALRRGGLGEIGTATLWQVLHEGRCTYSTHSLNTLYESALSDDGNYYVGGYGRPPSAEREISRHWKFHRPGHA